MIQNIATLVAARRGQQYAQQLQAQMSTLGQEVATGRKADISGELGGLTPILIGLRDAHERSGSYLMATATLETRLDTMQLAFSTIREAVGQLGWEALAAVGRADATSLGNVQLSAEATLATVVRQLNLTVAGRYLFSGSPVDTSPMVGGTAPAGVIDAVVTDAATAAGGQLGLADIAGLVADLDAIFADAHPDPALHFSSAFYQGAPAGEPPMAGQLDEGERLAYGIKANDQAFRDVLQGLHMLASVRFGDPIMTEDAYRSFVETGVERLQQGLAQLVDVAARTGQNQARVVESRDRLQAALDLYNRQIVDLERRDPYDAATLLIALEQQLQASYLVTSRLNQLSLAYFLR